MVIVRRHISWSAVGRNVAKMDLKRIMKNLRNRIRWRLDRARARAMLSYAHFAVDLRWKLFQKSPPHNLSAPVVVSLTSYRKRFPAIVNTLKSLITQSVKPDHLILWVGYSDLEFVPPEVQALCARGLEVRATDDIGPYTKIIPSLKAFPDACVVTADDDVYYRKDWLKGLLHEFRDPKEIICYRAHEIIFEEGGKPRPYKFWRHEIKERTASNLYLATGVGGVLYPPNSFAEETFNTEDFLRLCPGADDVWLYFMARRNGQTYRTVGKQKPLIYWDGTQEFGLVNENWEHGNDRKIAAMIAHYGFPH